MKQVLLILFIGCILFSCNENKSVANGDNTPSEQKKVLSVSIELKTTHDDEFRIMLNQIEVDEFQKMDIRAYEVIPATNNYDKMTARFFDKIISKKLVIGLGNKHLKTVDINRISMSYGTSSLVIPKVELSSYFNTNSYASFDNQMNIVTQKDNGRHLPALYANAKLINALTKD